MPALFDTYRSRRRLRRPGTSGTRSTALILAVIAGAGAAACTGSNDDASTDTLDAGSAVPTLGAACVVTDSEGLGGSALNRLVADGATAAAIEFDLAAPVLESESEDDYATHLDTFVEQQCTLIVAVGPALANATVAAANANPEQPFALVDFALDRQPANLVTVLFDTQQPAFLAGYVAAGVSATETVATFGGINIAAITDTMDGFANGVDLHNRVNGTTVDVLGWDGTNGVFAGNFDSVGDGAALAADLASQGADVILPVAGDVGIGAADFAASGAVNDTGDSGDPSDDVDVRIVGFGADRYAAEPEAARASVYLTSVTKNADTAVFDVIEAVVVDAELENYVGTLDNEGVGLAPYHDQDGSIPDRLKDEIDELLAGIVAGDIRVS